MMFHFQLAKGTSIRTQLDEFNKLMMDMEKVEGALNDGKHVKMCWLSTNSWNHFAD